MLLRCFDANFSHFRVNFALVENQFLQFEECSAPLCHWTRCCISPVTHRGRGELCINMEDLVMASDREPLVTDGERIVDALNKASEDDSATKSNISNVAAGTA